MKYILKIQIMCFSRNYPQPMMRPSAAQLLQCERLQLVVKVAETEKKYVHPSIFFLRIIQVTYRLSRVEARMVTIAAKELDIANCESKLAKQEEMLHLAVTRQEEEVAATIAHCEKDFVAEVQRREAVVMERMAWVHQWEMQLQEVWERAVIELKESVKVLTQEPQSKGGSFSLSSVNYSDSIAIQGDKRKHF